MDAIDLEDIDLSRTSRGDEDDAVSYGDVTVRRSHVSQKKPPIDRTGATSLVDLQLFTAPLEALRGTFASEGPVTSSQLPNVEEYKVQSAYTGGSKKKGPSSVREFFNEYGEVLFMGLMVLFILIGSFMVGSMVVKNGEDDGQVAAVTDTGDLSGDSASLHDEKRFGQLVDFISGEGWTSKFKLMDEGSPQMRAAVWLSDYDEKQVPIANTAALRERYALAVLHFATNGRDWARDVGFLSATDVCDWGIDDVKNKDGESIRLGADCTCRYPQIQDCDSKDETTVKRLLLPSMNLEGSIPHEIYLLYDLIELDLNTNRIHGELSQGILLLRSLRILHLQYNRLEGGIPKWIGDMVNLREINFASNMLIGKIPDEMSRLKNIFMLNLNNNQLTGGILPLQGLERVEGLFLGDNKLQGPLLPLHLNKWPVIRILDISDNELGGEMPPNLFMHPTLHVVDLHGNGIGGTIPDVTEGSQIEFLALQDNSLTGGIPQSIKNLSNLYHLDLSNNRLTGEIPLSLSALKNLEYLLLAFNAFDEGIVPHYLVTMPNLKDVSLQRTHRTGHIPPILGELSNLVMLDLGDNALSGEIPGTLGNLSNLHFLILYKNYLTGSIPTELHKLDKLQKLVVHDNDITERADYMCTPPQPQLRDFVMECDKDPSSDYPYCPCCKCCIEHDVNCNTLVWFGSVDPAWDTGFVRQHYKFHENDIPYTLDHHS